MTTIVNHFGQKTAELTESERQRIDQEIRALFGLSAFGLDDTQKRVATVGCILGESTIDDNCPDDDYLGIPATFQARIREALHKDLKNVTVPKRSRKNFGNPGANQEVALLLARSEVLLKRALARRSVKLKLANQPPDNKKAVKSKQCSEPLSPTHLKWLKFKDDVMPD